MISYLRKCLFVLGDKKKYLVPLTFSFLFVSLMEAFGIGLIGPFLSLATQPEIVQTNSFLNNLYARSGLPSESQFIACLGIFIILIFIFKSIISWNAQTYVFIFSFQLKGELANKLMNAYLNAPYTFHLSRNSATLIQSITNYTYTFGHAILIPLLNSIANVIVILSLTLLLCATNLMAIVAILALLLPCWLLFAYSKNKLSYWGQEVHEANESMIRIINHGLGGIKETKVIGCSSYFENQLKTQTDKYEKASGSFFGFKLLPRIIVETFLVIFLVGFISLFLLLDQDVQQLTAILSIFAVASIRLIPAISNLMGAISTLRNSDYVLKKLYLDLKELEASEENLKEIYGKHSDKFEAVSKQKGLVLADLPESIEPLEIKDSIEIEDIFYHYPNISESAIAGISFEIKKGESIALIGKSGAGKTTLVDIILGLLIPQDGDIKVDRHSIYENLANWRQSIGYIPQSIFLIDDTLARNIAFGVSDDRIDEHRLQQAIDAAQLRELVDELPEGLQTEVGERGVRLSGGQRQRVGIARALYHEREVLVLDEATAALDNETESLISEAINALSGTKTMIIIAHRLTTVKDCDRIYTLEKGKIVKCGTYEEVVLGEESHSD
ncbi:ABC transporter ATP-binding protein [Oxynema sp. CENA135]|uniref:ABC transporter ATP-binding protein n=1 Tax=Oxynema sp. CENA135 TaxID=984206 RepID=UPI00190C4B45|nr:ABC transporter ATP-binding protein [Oxynema sp. CENA135]MBK4732483.1 ABC transporter ATP-binding protein [Oxynema sp. CENA135]